MVMVYIYLGRVGHTSTCLNMTMMESIILLHSTLRVQKGKVGDYAYSGRSDKRGSPIK